MPRKTHIIPRAPVAQMLLDAGAKRVGKDAADAFAEIIQSIAEDIATQANKVALHSGRKTIKAEDIRLASKQ